MIYLILDRLPYLKSEAHLESVVSRESSFLFNNLILLASCFAVLWGTLFPVISEAVTGDKISVDRPFFERGERPIGLFLLFLTGVGPLIAWRRSSPDSLRRAFLWPSVAGLGVIAVLFGFGIRHFYALIAFGLCAFVTWTISSEFFKGSRAIRQRTNKNLLASGFELTWRNTRRYGGYMVHMGIVFMFIGFTGSAFNQDATLEVDTGSVSKIGHYDLRVADLQQGENENYAWHKAVIQVSRNGQAVATLEPERRLYKASKQPTSEVSIRRRLNEDLYLNFAGMSNDNSKAVIQAFVFPLVSWIWLGYWVLFFGTIVCLVPPKVKLAYARTEVVGVARKHAPVEK